MCGINGVSRMGCCVALVDALDAARSLVEPLRKVPGGARPRGRPLSRMFGRLKPHPGAWIPIDGTHDPRPGPRMADSWERRGRFYHLSRCTSTASAAALPPIISARRSTIRFARFIGAAGDRHQVALFSARPTRARSSARTASVSSEDDHAEIGASAVAATRCRTARTQAIASQSVHSHDVGAAMHRAVPAFRPSERTFRKSGTARALRAESSQVVVERRRDQSRSLKLVRALAQVILRSPPQRLAGERKEGEPRRARRRIPVAGPFPTARSRSNGSSVAQGVF
mgnify:CR=1 FL=1